MAAVADVHAAVAAFLEAAADALALTDAGPPGRIYVSPGQPALDCCGQLTAWASNLALADTVAGGGALAGAHRGVRTPAVPLATIRIQATRCAPTQTESGGRIVLPAPGDLAAAALAADQDVWAIYLHLQASLKDGDLADRCNGAFFDGATALVPQGGCVGWEFVYRLPLEAGRLST